jgi:spermidine synthase
VAKKYFGFHEDEKMRAFVADGRRFIEKSDAVYDVIYLDAFSADSVPYSLSTREFLQAARKALKPGGVVVGNVWSSYSNDLYHSMIRTYQDTFEHVAVVDVRGVGNKIVIAVPREKIAGKESVAEKAGAVALRAKFPYDLKDLVEYGYRRLTEPDAEGEVLRDR